MRDESTHNQMFFNKKPDHRSQGNTDQTNDHYLTNPKARSSCVLSSMLSFLCNLLAFVPPTRLINPEALVLWSIFVARTKLAMLSPYCLSQAHSGFLLASHVRPSYAYNFLWQSYRCHEQMSLLLSKHLPPSLVGHPQHTCL